MNTTRNPGLIAERIDECPFCYSEEQNVYTGVCFKLKNLKEKNYETNQL